MPPTSAKVDVLVSALGLVIQNRRKELGLSQDEIAQQAGLHRTYISEIECRSKNFSVNTFLQIAKALDLSPAALMQSAQTMADRCSSDESA